jgi:hypothetical protein
MVLRLLRHSRRIAESDSSWSGPPQLLLRHHFLNKLPRNANWSGTSRIGEALPQKASPGSKPRIGSARSPRREDSGLKKAASAGIPCKTRQVSPFRNGLATRRAAASALRGFPGGSKDAADNRPIICCRHWTLRPFRPRKIGDACDGSHAYRRSVRETR